MDQEKHRRIHELLTEGKSIRKIAAVSYTHLDVYKRQIQGGDYDFAIGTAGSCSLVMQTLLPALLQADQPSRCLLYTSRCV